jgi:pyruvate ferredoxin oxidoreductase gamma subunit
MYRIRFHGRGGQGIKTASRVVGSALFAAGFEVQDAPRYGAERRGAPIFAYVRADRRPIHERGIIVRPDLVVVADDSLIPVAAAGVLNGLDEGTTLLLHSRDDTATWRDRLNLRGPIHVLPAADDTVERGAAALAGITCAGAAARLLGIVAWEQMESAVDAELAFLPPAQRADNRAAARRGFDRMGDHSGSVREGERTAAAAYRAPDWIEVPFEDATVSAPAIHAAATSVTAKTGTWRTMRPVIDEERCHRCWWICSTFCPDGALGVEDGVPRIDYEHCKGCLVCVAVCPHHAIAAVPEHQQR